VRGGGVPTSKSKRHPRRSAGGSEIEPAVRASGVAIHQRQAGGQPMGLTALAATCEFGAPPGEVRMRSKRAVLVIDLPAGGSSVRRLAPARRRSHRMAGRRPAPAAPGPAPWRTAQEWTTNQEEQDADQGAPPEPAMASRMSRQKQGAESALMAWLPSQLPGGFEPRSARGRLATMSPPGPVPRGAPPP